MQRHRPNRFTRRTLLKGAFATMGVKLVPEGLLLAAQKIGNYNPNINPFKLKARLKALATSFGSGTPMDKVKRLFETLHKGGSLGVRVTPGAGRPPRTAAETLDKGGDCTELATLVIPLLREMKVPGGALVVHFKNAPAKVDHMVPYALIDGKKVIIDLQSDRLGATQQGKYTVLMTLSYDEAASMYHREWGDHLRDEGKRRVAIRAYRRALEIYEKDAYVHQNLGILYERSGNMKPAAKHLRRAAQLDPRYKKHQKRGTYNEELQKGEQALRERRWADCVEHFQNALDSGEKLREQEIKVIQNYRDHCKGKQ